MTYDRVEPKHTPRPWFYDGENMDSEAAASYGGNGYEIFTRDAQGEVDIPIAGEVIEEADARLIAAAPELLEALNDLVEHTEEFDGHGWQTEKARAAIQKARGP